MVKKPKTESKVNILGIFHVKFPHKFPIRPGDNTFFTMLFGKIDDSLEIFKQLRWLYDIEGC